MVRMPRMKCQDVEQVLRRHDFVLVSQKGSHRKWRHAERHLQVVVPEHSGRDLPIGTLRAILANAEIPESEWHA